MSKTQGHMNFFSEMAEYQNRAREFFNADLLDSIDRNFGMKDVLISYFNTEGDFLSWAWKGKLRLDSTEHPYHEFLPKDMVRYTIYAEAVRDRLDYYNMVPRIYRATDIIGAAYDYSPYVRFLQEQFHAHYSVTLAFGINAYIQVTFFKKKEDGDFTEEEMTTLSEVYVYVANSYRNFKKFEQAKIMSDLQDEIMASGEKAYMITDDFMHIMDYNKKAQNYIAEILGPVNEPLSSKSPCGWLPFLLGGVEKGITQNGVKTRVVGDFVFRIHTHDQTYSNGIIDRYHWITLSRTEENENLPQQRMEKLLTKTERQVASYLYQGMTYKAIAAEMQLSYHTVKKHVENIYTRAGVQSRHQLIRWMEQ